MENLELNDIQGIIVRGYANMPAGAFSVLRIVDAGLAKKWLQNVTGQITAADEKKGNSALNIAFTFNALSVLGLSNQTLDTFPMELEDGMNTKHKQFFLGDYGTSDPAKWEWGGNNGAPVHILLMLYAVDKHTLEEFHEKQSSQFALYGLEELKKLDTSILYERKEHFGFQDGISQPTIKGLSRQDVPENMISAGEFILGYKNEYNQYTPTPLVNEDSTAAKILPTALDAQGKYDLGRNGSYLVFRQLKQDVGLFWSYMAKCTRDEKGACDDKEMVKLAAKMLGRWPGGAPVVICPDEEIKDHNDENNFNYQKVDELGLKCPFASHIRRSHPRDSLDMDKTASIKVANKHRILRRGRSYGTPVTETMNPHDILKVNDIKGERGLHFICFNGDIGRQFEFIQNAWSNNPKFNGLHDERDPITGNHSYPENTKTTGTFTIPDKNLRKRFTDVPEFVTVKGGAYFFMPGIKALKYISCL
ncbi:Dyp-type peroxidase [Segetibacter sp.]|jgi:Dyp-type peroxidase family|uniref:Dyp-type peroxidase n=1 Tax=Segetibacter sp. TaxID=2231182 RepID=UPI002630E423|nr:Dyp-type peroxidase [Segetibacter sp.]MCW3081660.1 peroxidase [Segetibacter sp.]